MLSVGVDLVHIPRIVRALDRYGDRFLCRIYTEREVAYCRGRTPELAARFAAKEAVAKALGVGMRLMSPYGIGFQDVEVLADRLGKPILLLAGRAAERAAELGLVEWSISLSHERDLAIAFVAALANN